MNDHTRFYLMFLGMVFLAAVLLIVQPYSADWPGTAYSKPARRYIRAMIEQDSVGLLQASASVAPVVWGLRVARAHRDSVALWGRRIRAFTGEQRGDTTEVFVYPPREGCGKAPIVLWFVGSGREARVLRARSACFDPT